MVDPAQVNVDRFLRVVLAVAEERQITQAAVRLGTAQPWVSRQLREVEEEVGVKLFKRVHKGVEATPSGEVFIEEARQAVFHSELSVSRARAANASVLDKLLIGVSPTFDPDLYEGIRDCLRSALPRIKLAFDSKFVSEQIEDIQRTDLHMGLAELPIRAGGLKALLLWRAPMLLAGGQGEPLLTVSSLNTENLNRKPCMILTPRQNPSQQRMVELLYKCGMEVDNLREVLTLPEALYPVMRGKAVAVLPPVAGKLQHEGVVFRAMSSVTIDYSLIVHQDHRNQAIKTFLSAAQRYFATERAEIKSQKNEGARRQHEKATAC